METKTELNLTLDLNDLIYLVVEKATRLNPDWQVKKLDFIYKDISTDVDRYSINAVNGVTIIMEPKVMKKEDGISFR